MSDTQSDSDDAKWRAAMAACVTSARNLLDAAKAVAAIGKYNIAYHLAVASLEELGKRELIALQAISSKEAVPPSWPEKHAQDHVHKLFWAFFGPSFYESLNKKALEDMQGLARRIHEKRLGGLYVDVDETGVFEPHLAIPKKEAEDILGFADIRVQMAESEKPRTPKPEEAEQQAWFLRTASDPRTRNLIMGGPSLAKLAELKDARAWVRWLKGEFDKAEADGIAAMQAELQRSKNLPEKPDKDKWKIRMRIFSDSHSIRPNVLNFWNDKSDWIKLIPVSGKKNQFILELVLADSVPIEGLWYFGWGVARHFVTALNIGSMGFFWWRMPEQISRYYETIVDLQSNLEIGLERHPSLKVDWGENRVLTQDDLARAGMAFAALPRPDQQHKHAAYNFYITGITFMSLNDVHWQCEIQVFGNFFESLKAMMKDHGDWDGTAPFEVPLLKFLTELFSSFPEREQFVALCKSVDAKTVKAGEVTLKEASFMKLFCDAYFMRKIQPGALREVDEWRKAKEETEQAATPDKEPEKSEG